MHYCCITRKYGGKIKMPVFIYGKQCYKEILFTDEKKKLLWMKLLISKTIEFMHSHPRKPANWCQGSKEIIILLQ
jgi:hypothetical protein